MSGPGQASTACPTHRFGRGDSFIGPDPARYCSRFPGASEPGCWRAIRCSPVPPGQRAGAHHHRFWQPPAVRLPHPGHLSFWIWSCFTNWHDVSGSGARPSDSTAFRTRPGAGAHSNAPRCCRARAHTVSFRHRFSRCAFRALNRVRCWRLSQFRRLPLLSSSS